MFGVGCAYVGALPLSADEAEVFDRAGAGGSEPVRSAGVELGCFACLKEQILIAEHEAQGAVEYIGPVEALMGMQVWYCIVAARGEDEFECLDSSGASGERDDDRPIGARHGPQIDTGVRGAGGIDEGVEGDAVVAGQRQQLFQGRSPQSGFEAREGARGDAGLIGKGRQGDVAAQSEVLQAEPYGVEGLVIVFAHTLI